MKKLLIVIIGLTFLGCLPSKRDQYFYFFSNSTNEMIDIKIYDTKSKVFVKSYVLPPIQKTQFFEENIGEGDGSGLVISLKIGGDSAAVFKNNIYKFSQSIALPSENGKSIFMLNTYKKEIFSKKKYDEVQFSYTFSESDF